MAVKEKKTKKPNKTKQKGGLPEPLSTIFKDGPPNTTIVGNIENNIKFIIKIKELLVSQQYQGNNIPVFYGNTLSNNNGYNEYICKTILGRFGGISSRRRIFIITAIFKKSIVFSNKNIAFLNISVKTIKHQPSL